MWNTVQPMTLVCVPDLSRPRAGRISRYCRTRRAQSKSANGRRYAPLVYEPLPGDPIAHAYNWPMCKAADRLALGALALMAVLAWSGVGFGQPRPADAVTRTLGRKDDSLRRLFTPATFPPGTFTVHRSDERIERLAARLRALDPAPVAGAWRVERAGVFDAFGAEGPYDKPRLARLFGGVLAVCRARDPGDRHGPTGVHLDFALPRPVALVVATGDDGDCDETADAVSLRSTAWRQRRRKRGKCRADDRRTLTEDRNA